MISFHQIHKVRATTEENKYRFYLSRLYHCQFYGDAKYIVTEK
jgi:hypothetical protein